MLTIEYPNLEKIYKSIYKRVPSQVSHHDFNKSEFESVIKETIDIIINSYNLGIKVPLDAVISTAIGKFGVSIELSQIIKNNYFTIQVDLSIVSKKTKHFSNGEYWISSSFSALPGVKNKKTIGSTIIFSPEITIVGDKLIELVSPIKISQKFINILYDEQYITLGLPIQNNNFMRVFDHKILDILSTKLITKELIERTIEELLLASSMNIHKTYAFKLFISSLALFSSKRMFRFNDIIQATIETYRRVYLNLPLEIE